MTNHDNLEEFHDLLPDGIFTFETRNPSGHNLDTTEDEEYWQTHTSVQGNCVSISGTQLYEFQRSEIV